MIVESGYSGASFSRIAKQAGLSSTGLISYHFAGKQDLMTQVVRHVLDRFAEYVLAYPDEGTFAGQLRAFIDGTIGFLAGNRAEMIALLRVQDAQPDNDAVVEITGHDAGRLSSLLRQGQEAGEFGSFDPGLMAGFILALRGEVIARAAADPDFDLDHCSHELNAAINAMTREGQR